MKTSLTKLSSSVLFFSLSLAVYAKPVAQVTEVSGSVFVITPTGDAKTLKLNQHIEEKSEIMVEEGATVTLNDYYDSTYHLTGGTHLKFYDKSVQLKKGKSWIQAENARHPLALTTANGHVDYWKGEFIATFDQASSRTQVLVVNGDVEVSNILDKNMKYTVAAGTFTMVDPEVESGIPRSPTKVGLQSLNEALSEFKQLPTKLQAAPVATSRAIASVEEEPVKKGKIIFIKSSRHPASVTGGAHKYYKSKVFKKVDATPVPIHFYGTNFQVAEPVTPYVKTPREPASVQVSLPKHTQNLAPKLDVDQEFAESLKKHAVEQPKYSKELNSLINDLKSY